MGFAAAPLLPSVKVTLYVTVYGKKETGKYPSELYFSDTVGFY